MKRHVSIFRLLLLAAALACSLAQSAYSEDLAIIANDPDTAGENTSPSKCSVLIDKWGVMTNEVGTGGPITFEPQILEGQPQMFYRVETIQRK